MNLLFKTLALLCLAGFSAPIPQGLFGGLRNLLGGLAPRGRGRPQSRPQQPSRPVSGGGNRGGSGSMGHVQTVDLIIPLEASSSSYEGAAVSLDSAAKEREFGSLLTR